MTRPMTQRVLDEAIKRTPGSVAKMSRGKPTSRERKAFSVYTVSRLMQEFRDPRAILLEIASTDTAKLAKDMNCTMLDALAERRLAAISVLPYVSQRLPTQVDLRQSRAIHLNLVDDARYQELVAVAAAEPATNDGDFSMQLLASSPVVEQSVGARSETPVIPPVAPALAKGAEAGSDRWRKVDGGGTFAPSRSEADWWNQR